MSDPFHFHDGRSARSIRELLHTIEESPQNIFDEHVSDSRNDFAAWIELSLKEKKLAEKLKKTQDRLQTIIILRAWLEHQPLHVQFPFTHKALTKEFLIGLAFGLIIGLLTARMFT